MTYQKKVLQIGALWPLVYLAMTGGVGAAEPTDRAALTGISHSAADLRGVAAVIGPGAVAQADAPPAAPDAPGAAGSSDSSKANSDKDVALDETVVEGARLRRRSTPVYVIDKEEIRQKGAQNVADALRGLPGFAINDVGRGADFHNGSYYRGATVNQSALLINGRQLKTGLNSNHGATDLNSLPVEGIKRIELLGTGAGTTLYGADVVGGVINIITDEGERVPTLNAEIAYGSFGESIYRTSYGGTSGRLNYRLGYQSYGATNDFRVPLSTFGVPATNRAPDGRLQNSDLYTAGYQGTVGYRFDERNTVTFDLYKNLSRKGLVIGNSRDRLDRDALNVGLTWRSNLGEGDDSVLVTTIGYVDDFFSTYGPLSGGFFKGVQLASKFYLARVDHTWRTSPGNTLRWGIDARHNTLLATENTTSPTFSVLNGATDTGITNIGVFALDSWQIGGGVQLEAGLRQSFDSKFGNYLNPSVGLRWEIDPAVALRASFATVQRNPGPDFLFVPDAAEGFLPNPDLLPERGSVWNAGVDLRFGTFSAQLTYFGNLLENRIGNGPVPGNPSQTRRDNIGTVDTNGFEAGLRYQIDPQWSAFLNYTYTKIKTEPGRNLGLLRFLPESVAQLGIGYDHEGWQVNLFANYNSGAARTVSLTTYTLPFFTFDLRAAVPITRNVAFTVFLANLADVQYERVTTFYTPGLTWRLGMQTQF